MTISTRNSVPFTAATQKAGATANTQQAQTTNSSSEVEQAADGVTLSGGPEVAETPKAAAVANEAPTRRAIPGSYIIKAPANSLSSVSDSHPNLDVEKVLGSDGESVFYLANQSKSEAEVMSDDGTLPANVYPNYEYEGDLYDEPLPPSVFKSEMPESGVQEHLGIIHVAEAWKVTQGSPDVLSAVTDTGVDLNHPELKDSFWTNTKEIAGNGIDDDNNGYIDDTRGWDVTDGDNDPNDTGSQHHTHVHGIIHAANDGTGVTGVAPGAKGIALRIAGGKRRYSSAVVAEAYLYAMKEGAKTINTSFNINGFVGDKLIEDTYKTLADNDVLVFNSAGNSGELNSAREAFEDVVLVAATDTAASSVDKRASFSNYGVGVDIAAPGKDILSTLPGRTGRLSGTSMASPVAASVDLLVQSAHPDWNRNQRWAQISGTADNIDGVNPNEAGLLGGGRINAGRALNETVSAPTLSATEKRDASGKLKNIGVRFNKVLEPASANVPDAWRIEDAEGNVAMKGAPKEVRLLTNEIAFDVSSLPAGSYKLVGSAEHLHDPFGQALDGNADGKAGGDFVKEFTVG